jgi:hypothetical protein
VKKDWLPCVFSGKIAGNWAGVLHLWRIGRRAAVSASVECPDGLCAIRLGVAACP